MFKLQSPIATSNRAEEKAELRSFLAARAAEGMTPELAFAAWWNKKIAEEAIEDMNTTRSESHIITKLALFSSLFHQMGFFLAAASSWFVADSTEFGSNPMHWIGPLSVLSGAFAIPMVIDISILITVRNLTMKVASPWSRVCNFLGMTLFAAASSWINFNAPSPHLIFNYGFGGVVLAIPVIMGLRAFFHPLFGQLGKKKKATLAEAAAPSAPAAGKRCPEGCKCKKHTRRTTSRKRPSRARKADPMVEILETVKDIKTEASEQPAPVTA